MKNFSCRRCGNCCRWPGAVKLAEGEAEAIAVFLNMSEEDEYRLTQTHNVIAYLKGVLDALEK